MDKLQLPQKIENSKLSQFFNLENLGNIANAIPVVPGVNTVGGILLAVNYAKQEQFLLDVIEERLAISQKEINKEEFLKRFYLTSQVIAKSQTQEKYNRFKKLLINSTLYEISDNDYELYNNLIDNLSDLEFIVLIACYEFYPHTCDWQRNDNRYDCFNIHEHIGAKIANNILNSDELKDYLNLLYSKGLIHQDPIMDGGMFFASMSIIGKNLIKFINKKGDAND